MGKKKSKSLKAEENDVPKTGEELEEEEEEEEEGEEEETEMVYLQVDTGDIIKLKQNSYQWWQTRSCKMSNGPFNGSSCSACPCCGNF